MWKGCADSNLINCMQVDLIFYALRLCMMAADTPEDTGMQQDWEDDDSWGDWHGDAQGQWVWTPTAAAEAAAAATATTTAAVAAAHTAADQAHTAADQAQAAAAQAQTAASMAQNSVGRCWDYVEQAGEAATEVVSSQSSSS